MAQKKVSIKERKLWVVEVLFKGSDKWETTLGVELNRADGRRELGRWKTKNPDSQFRLKTYIAKG